MKLYSKGTSTGNLKAHLLESHSISDLPSSQDKRTIKQWFAPQTTNRQQGGKDLKLAEDLFLLCAKDLYPFQIAEKEGFVDFSRKYLPTKSLPTRQTIVRAGARIYQGVRNFEGIR